MFSEKKNKKNRFLNMGVRIRVIKEVGVFITGQSYTRISQRACHERRYLAFT